MMNDNNSNILSYPNIYRAPITILTIQRKCFRCGSRGGINVLEEGEDVMEIPDMSLACSRRRKPFQVKGPVTVNAQH